MLVGAALYLPVRALARQADERHHHRQVERFCAGDFTVEPRLTTFPGVHAVLAAVARPLGRCGDLPFLRLLNRTFLWWHLALAAVLFGTGWLVWDVRTGLSFLVYGMSVRLVYVLHVTWFVNSASHMWGYRNFDTPDDSRNLWWVGLLAYGEGWHNNHHASQRSARHGLRWWELDVTYLTICLMERCGLAWKVARDAARTPSFGQKEILSLRAACPRQPDRPALWLAIPHLIEWL